MGPGANWGHMLASIGDGYKLRHVRAGWPGMEVEKADKVLTLVTCAGQIIPRTTRAGMVCRVVDTIPAQ